MTQPLDELLPWVPRLGEQVVVIPDSDDWASDWIDAAGNPVILWVAAVEALPSGGVNVTISEDWPIRPRGAFDGKGGSSLTDGFTVGREGEPDNLQPLNTRSDTELVRLRANVELAARTFRRYEELHRQKGTSDGDEKAERNRELAETMEAALSEGGGV